MVDIIKLNPQHEERMRYQGEWLVRDAQHAIIKAYWTRATLDLGYTRFEPGDCFIEYYYTERWFNIFAISRQDGTRKGWYCNIAEPATILTERIEQVDLFLDVWIDASGQAQVLDEDEFQATTSLNEKQRRAALQGLQELLALLHNRQEMFADL